MTSQEWSALIRMTTSTSTNSYSGHYKGIPIEVTTNTMLTRVRLDTNHDNIVQPMSFTKDSPLLPLYRKVFKELYRVWYDIKVDNLPF